MDRDRPGISLAIIGGGASAVLLLAHLSRVAGEKFSEIIIYDKAGAFAKGIAYSTMDPVHLLNVRATNMSALQNNPAHFSDWLAANGFDYGPMDFVPRVIYAQYLEHVLKAAQKEFARHGCTVSLKTENAGSVEDVKADIVVIATGNAVPLRPQGEGYHDHPWGIDYKSIRGDVIILGAGLSMVDTVLSLKAAGFSGNITAISRRGLVPAVHVPPQSYPEFLLPATVLGILRSIRAEVRKAEKKNVSWQAVIDSLRSKANSTWLSLSEIEKRKMKRLLPYWNIHRHRMAPQVAETLGKTNLIIIKDEVRHVRGGMVDGRKGHYKADHVINCLGYTYDKNFIFKPAGEARGVFALGPALQGAYFETTAIPEIRAQADEIAKKISKR